MCNISTDNVLCDVWFNSNVKEKREILSYLCFTFFYKSIQQFLIHTLAVMTAAAMPSASCPPGAMWGSSQGQFVKWTMGTVHQTANLRFKEENLCTPEPRPPT